MNTVKIVRQYAASPALVWCAWTDPAIVSRWFGSDPAGRVLAATLDVRTGGDYSVTFQDSTGLEHTASGRYYVVDEARQLEFTWTWKSEPDVETLVKVSLEQSGTGTQMRFEHSRLWEGSAHGYREGWQRTFEKMERAIAENR